MSQEIPFMRIRLVADMEDGKTVELLNVLADKDGNVRQFDESSVDTLLKSPDSAKLWGTAFTSLGGMLLGAFYACEKEFRHE